MDNEKTVKVVDFTKIPGARHRDDGDKSAQEFFEDVLHAVAEEQLVSTKDGKLLLDLDYTVGYPSSFISELAKLMSIEYKKIPKISKRLIIKSDEDPGLIESFWHGFKQNYNQ